MELIIGKMKLHLETLIIILLFSLLIFGHTCLACSRSNPNYMSMTGSTLGYSNVGREGFASVASSALPYKLNNKQPDFDTNTWKQIATTVSSKTPMYEPTKDARTPLPGRELDFFFNTPFKPECCPNSFSTDRGCACTTQNQNAYLVTRGGNNVPYSEY